MSKPVQAAIYCRISRDREGAGLGVDRQEADCRALAERLGWEVAAVFVDNDISAYSGKPRPQYKAMLDAVRGERVGGVIAWHTDRLHRRATELEEFVTVAEEHALQVETVTAGKVDLSTPSGRMVARMLSAAAQHEVEQTRKRARRKKQEAAELGLYRGGPRPFGFESDGVTIREDEAQVIRDATKAILSGRSLSAVARELNEKGRKTSMGREWTYMRLRDVLVRPRNAGLLSTGRPDRAESGFQIIGDAVWPAVIDEDTWRACHNLLLDPSRRVAQNTEARWIGSNTYLCGIEGCGSLMRSTSSTDKRAGKIHRRHYYRCSEQNHLSIHSHKTDAFVRDVVAEKVRDPRVIQAMLGHDSESTTRADRERRAILVMRMEQTETDYDDDLIDARTRKRKVDKAQAEIEEIDARLAEAAKQSTASPIFTAADPGKAFLDAPIDVQRAVLRSVLRITVMPVAKRGDKWSSDRLQITPA